MYAAINSSLTRRFLSTFQDLSITSIITDSQVFKNLYFLVDRRRPVVTEKYKHDLLLLMKIIEAGVEMMK